ncbi:phage tail length tape measure family protein [Ketogulonicigenium vulgare]|uniref:phage tail length tape measure family protein n=1 Tax=Ketogulonicigenium vulgare TaxID=92945 RepID=UPI0023585697|nr:phage tail length tape measure family protein [Ketogulonicigenium vulgare]
MAEDTDGIIVPIGVTENQFLQQMARIEARAAAAAHKAEQNFLKSNKGIAKSFADSEANMARLNAKYNPLFNASKQYEAAVNDLEDAFLLGIIPLKKYEAEMLRLQSTIGRPLNDSIKKSIVGYNASFASAGQSAEVFGSEMDRLQRKFNPIYAASKRYEAAVEELNTAHRMGVVNAAQYEQALELLNADLQNPGRGMSGALDGVSRSANGLNGNLSNIAAQFNDIGVTAAMGMNPMLIALQQGTQISQVFAGMKTADVIKNLQGAFMAFISPVALATVALVAGAAALAQWGFSAIQAGMGGANFESRLKTLNEAIDDYASSAKDANASTEDLIRKYGTAANAARGFLQSLSELDLREATKAMNDTIDTFLDGIGRRVSPLDEDIAIRVGIDADDVQAFRRLRDELELSDDAAVAATKALDDLSNAANMDEEFAAMQAFVAALQSGLPAAEDMSDRQREVWRSVLDASTAMAQLVGLSQNAAGALDNTADAAAGIADELQRALRAARGLATAGLDDVAVAEVELRYRTDPVGRAGALRALEFDQQFTDLDPSVRGVAQIAASADRQAAIDRARAAEILRQQRASLDDADRESERESNRRGKLSDPIVDSERETAAIREQIAAFQELRLAGEDVDRGMAVLARTQEILNQYQRDNIALTPEIQAAAARAAQAYVDAADEMARIDQVAQTGQSALEGMFGSIIDGSKSAKAAIGDLLLEIAKVQFVKGMMGLIGSTSWGGGLIDAIGSGLSYDTGGYTGPGGRYQPAGVVHKGEVVWSQDDVRRVGGPAAAEALRRHAGLPGYSEGGLVGMSAPDAALRVPVSTSRSTSIALSIDVTGARGNAEIAEMVEAGVSNGLARAAAVQERTFNARVRRANASGRKN